MLHPSTRPDPYIPIVSSCGPVVKILAQIPGRIEPPDDRNLAGKAQHNLGHRHHPDVWHDPIKSHSLTVSYYSKRRKEYSSNRPDRPLGAYRHSRTNGLSTNSADRGLNDKLARSTYMAMSALYKPP